MRSTVIAPASNQPRRARVEAPSSSAGLVLPDARARYDVVVEAVSNPSAVARGLMLPNPTGSYAREESKAYDQAVAAVSRSATATRTMTEPAGSYSTDESKRYDQAVAAVSRSVTAARAMMPKPRGAYSNDESKRYNLAVAAVGRPVGR